MPFGPVPDLRIVAAGCLPKAKRLSGQLAGRSPLTVARQCRNLHRLPDVREAIELSAKYGPGGPVLSTEANRLRRSVDTAGSLWKHTSRGERQRVWSWPRVACGRGRRRPMHDLELPGPGVGALRASDSPANRWLPERRAADSPANQQSLGCGRAMRSFPRGISLIWCANGRFRAESPDLSEGPFLFGMSAWFRPPGLAT